LKRYNRTRDKNKIVRLANLGYEEFFLDIVEILNVVSAVSCINNGNEAYKVFSDEEVNCPEDETEEEDPWLEAEWDDITRDRYMHEGEGEE